MMFTNTIRQTLVVAILSGLLIGVMGVAQARTNETERILAGIAVGAIVYSALDHDGYDHGYRRCPPPPRYCPPPYYYTPQPYYYTPQPYYYTPQPYYYTPQPYYYAPPHYGGPTYSPPRHHDWDHDRDRDHRGDRRGVNGDGYQKSYRW